MNESPAPETKTSPLGLWVPVLFLVVGLIIGLQFNLTVPEAYSRYTAVSILAALDAVFGAIRAELNKSYSNRIFISGFISNIVLAAGLTFLGDRLGVDLSLAAVVAFGVRLFDNLAIIRRHFV
ncbi:MAG: small basic family protein [Chloroflexota bacterium]